MKDVFKGTPVAETLTDADLRTMIERIQDCAAHQKDAPTPPPQGWHDEPPPESPLVLVVGGLMVLACWGLVALVLYLIAY